MIAILTLFSVLAFTTRASEPQCSPFHFVEQTLTKVIQVEMLVQKMKEDFETTQQKVLDKLQELGTEKKEFKSDLNTELENMQREYNEMKEKNREQMRESAADFEKIKDNIVRPVLFLAKDVIDLTPSNGQRLIFKTSMKNEGNGYDTTTGIFTAPVAGVYLFTLQLCLPSGTSLFYSIVAENNSLKQGYFYDRNSDSCHTADAITTLRLGGTVWITITRSGGKLNRGSDYWNTFSGVLIHSLT